MSTLVVLQPGYLPWLGFFDQMRRADVFVVYDDVQFDKHGWRNRNRIKSPAGPVWLTVPVLHGGLQRPRLSDVRIDGRAPWARKHLGTIRQHYARAPHFHRVFPALEEALSRPWERLVELDLALVDLMCGWLHLKPRVVRSSQLDVTGTRSARLVQLCRHLGSTRYLSGDAAASYLDLGLFGEAGIEVEWQRYRHPVYPQLHGEFVPYLSAIDMILNCGDRSAELLRGAAPLERT